ncbi:hypothetical protein [Vogesella sp. LIG4]|uniref:hypothetical protein n=1 Tax=Vogesella sp. LIG4 TaxID=1192162 RepID=UPI00081FD1D7|nr:hypothetical protein [Vogesella sp. LIG4]SCK08553.1 hypothetical protein PSELUDRAFT_0520 [Vogesella sp. LIG4]
MGKSFLYYFSLALSLLWWVANSSAAEVDDQFLTGVYFGIDNTFPARLELTPDHKFAWSLYRDGEYQAKGTWAWDGAKITLLTVPEGKELNMEKLPPGVNNIGAHWDGIDVCLHSQGRRYYDYGPGGVEIALENKRKEKIAPSKYKEFSDLICVQFSFGGNRKTEGGEEGSEEDGVPTAILKEWSYVAVRPRGESNWKRYPVSYTERKKRVVSFQVIDSSSTPAPFEKADLTISGDVLAMDVGMLSGKYRKITGGSFVTKIDGKYENEWGRLDIHGNGKYEWYWNVPCCFTKTIKGRWSEEAGFLILQGDRDFYSGGYKLLNSMGLKKIGVYPRELEAESSRKKTYTAMVASVVKNGNIKKTFLVDMSGYEVNFLDVNGKSLGVAVSEIMDGASIYRKNYAGKLYKIAVRQFDVGAPWRFVEIPRNLRNSSLIIVSPDGNAMTPVPWFNRNIANINPDGGVTIRNPIGSQGLITYKKIE